MNRYSRNVRPLADADAERDDEPFENDLAVVDLSDMEVNSFLEQEWERSIGEFDQRAT